MKALSITLFVLGMLFLGLAEFVLPSQERSQRNREAAWRLREAIAKQASIEETRAAANDVLVFSKEIGVSTGLAQIGLRAGMALLLASAVSVAVFLKKKSANQQPSLNEKMDTVVYTYHGLEVVRRDGRLFVHADAGAHQEIWREDEITEEELRRISANPESCTKVLIEIQNRLIARGIDPYQSNWSPHRKPQT